MAAAVDPAPAGLAMATTRGFVQADSGLCAAPASPLLTTGTEDGEADEEALGTGEALAVLSTGAGAAALAGAEAEAERTGND